MAELNYRTAKALPNIESRARVAAVLREVLALFDVSVARFAAMHDVNEKQAAKWLSGEANYPGWGFDLLPEDMSDELFARIRAAKSGARTSPMKRALGWLRREGELGDVFEAQQELLAISMSKAGGSR